MADTEQLEEDKRCTLFDRKTRFCQRCSEFHTADEWGETCERYLGAAPIRQCKTCGGWHPLDAWRGNCLPEPNWNRSEHPSPGFISDTVEVKSMINGKVFDSKSKYYRHVAQSGCEIVGNEEQRLSRPQPSEREIDRDIGQSVKDSLDQLRAASLSNDEMANMLRAPIESQGGFNVQ